MGGKVGENPAALRAAVFFAILEKPEGGAFKRPPPPAGRGLRRPHTMPFGARNVASAAATRRHAAATFAAECPLVSQPIRPRDIYNYISYQNVTCLCLK